MTLFDPAFTSAKARSEFSFIQTLLAIRGLQDPGWNPFITSIEVIDEMCALHAKAETLEAKRDLELWLYGHAVEASEPYELLANLIDVAQGGLFHLARFPPKKGHGPPSPGDKIKQLEKAAKDAEMTGAVTPMREVWNRDLRNAIFHSDYSRHKGEVRFKQSWSDKDGTTHSRFFVYKNDEILTLVNRALAYFRALQLLRSHHISLYTEPKEIAGDPRLFNDPNERAVVMVREGHGVIGLKDAWTARELATGHMRWHLARLSNDELMLSELGPTRAFFPARAVHSDDPEP